MAGASLFTLLDDIASVLDDVAALTKLATKKTAGVLGDDLALNAEQVSAIDPDRELPVVWAVARGSAVNKLILVPAMLAFSAFAGWAVQGLLLLGGAYLCFEGFEKLAHKFTHTRKEDAAHHAEHLAHLAQKGVDPADLEKEKVKGAIRTDFVLSAEIVVITLGSVAHAAFWTQVAVLAGIAAIMTVGVYGLVAGIVKLDDAGLYLSGVEGERGWDRMRRRLGRSILFLAPWLMKGLSVAGTAAMFLVGGGILAHGLPGVPGVVHAVEHAAAKVPGVGGVLEALTPLVLNAVVGVLCGAVVLLVVIAAKRLFRRPAPAPTGGS